MNKKKTELTGEEYIDDDYYESEESAVINDNINESEAPEVKELTNNLSELTGELNQLKDTIEKAAQTARENESKSTIQSNIKNKRIGNSLIAFILKIVISITLSILALNFIKPAEQSDVFYKLYFILFIIFEIGVILCYVFANKSIYLLKNFAKNVIENKGRYSSFNSKNKKVNDVCNAYKKSFLVSDDEDYHKTRANSDLYFGPETWLQDTNPLPI